MTKGATLKFFFGTMGSGKSTQALQINHNLTNRGLKVMLISQLDREEGRVSSRLGVSAEATIVTPDADLLHMARTEMASNGLDAIVCDEAQFYAPEQIEQLAMVVDLLDVDVFAFGLLTSFQGELFPGSARLMELADERSEVQVEARCFCGRRATHNARLVDGRQVYAGALKVVGDTTERSDATTTYELRCRFHWHETLWEQQGRQLQLPVDHGADVIDLKTKAVENEKAENK
jgi:thymidine kinase